MTVKSARLVFAHRLAASRSIPGFDIATSAFPRIWRTPHTASPSSVVVNAATPDLALRALGLAGLEERWRRNLPDQDLDTWPLTDIDQVPAWLDLASARDHFARDMRAATRRQGLLRCITTTSSTKKAPAWIQLW
jgi:hypothetical protein